MNDAAFNAWFASTGHKWRGWPTWDYEEDGFLEEVETIHTGLKYSEQFKEWQVAGKERSTHEAACLIRDFLVYDCGIPLYGAPTKRETANARLVAAVEAQMQAEGKV